MVKMDNNKTRVFIIEDDVEYAAMEEMILSKSDDLKFDSVSSTTLEDGLTELKNNDFDVLLLDLNLPDCSELDTFNKVSISASSLPIIILTGDDDQQLAIRSLKLGAQDYLIKGQTDNKLLFKSILFSIDRKRLDQELKSALKEKDALLKEIHHRVKNNLQIVSSLLMLQSEYTKDKKAIESLNESTNRIDTMAFIHEHLYRSTDLYNVNFLKYVETLVSNLYNSFGYDPEDIKVELNISLVSLSADDAIHCGLIINELVTNSLKYAFPKIEDVENEVSADEIRVSLNLDSKNDRVLILSDNGIGLPEHLDIQNSTTFGLSLVSLLVQQLKGSIELDTTKGTKFIITFPI
jgi:two-component sensor histidine kinase